MGKKCKVHDLHGNFITINEVKILNYSTQKLYTVFSTMKRVKTEAERRKPKAGGGG